MAYTLIHDFRTAAPLSGLGLVRDLARGAVVQEQAQAQHQARAVQATRMGTAAPKAPRAAPRPPRDMTGSSAWGATEQCAPGYLAYHGGVCYPESWVWQSDGKGGGAYGPPVTTTTEVGGGSSYAEPFTTTTETGGGSTFGPGPTPAPYQPPTPSSPGSTRRGNQTGGRTRGIRLSPSQGGAGLRLSPSQGRIPGGMAPTPAPPAPQQGQPTGKFQGQFVQAPSAQQQNGTFQGGQSRLSPSAQQGSGMFRGSLVGSQAAAASPPGPSSGGGAAYAVLPSGGGSSGPSPTLFAPPPGLPGPGYGPSGAGFRPPFPGSPGGRPPQYPASRGAYAFPNQWLQDHFGRSAQGPLPTNVVQIATPGVDPAWAAQQNELLRSAQLGPSAPAPSPAGPSPLVVCMLIALGGALVWAGTRA